MFSGLRGTSLKSLELQGEGFFETSQLIETVAPPCQCPYASSVVGFELPNINSKIGEAKGIFKGVKTSLRQIRLIAESSFKTVEIRQQLIVRWFGGFSGSPRRVYDLKTNIVAIPLKHGACPRQTAWLKKGQ